MALSNELSSEIAIAILSAKKRPPSELNDLKEIVLKIHYTLQQMTDEARAARRKALLGARAARQQ